MKVYVIQVVYDGDGDGAREILSVCKTIDGVISQIQEHATIYNSKIKLDDLSLKDMREELELSDTFGLPVGNRMYAIDSVKLIE
jgi:hypothetical protein